MEAKLNLLQKLYTNPQSPVAYAGINALLKEARKVNQSINKKDVIYFLEGNRTYTLHRPRKIHFKRSKTIPSGFMTDVQVDLADFQKLARQNNDFKYILVGIDVLSKRVFATPTKSKNYKDMVEASDRLVEQMPMIPHTIFSDRGTEFLLTKNGENYFKNHDILKYRSSTKTIKASLAERCIRNIKQRLYRYFSEKHTLNWVDVLTDIINGINHSYSRIIKMRPVDVNFKNAQEIWENLFGKYFYKEPLKKSKHITGSNVRMANYKEVFDRGYLPNWSDEIFNVSKVKRGMPDTYKVTDEKGEQFEGNFYAEDLGKVRKDTNTTYRIKVLKRKTKNGIKECYVKFLGYKDTPEWIPQSDIV